jgi:hypothetical protein
MQGIEEDPVERRKRSVQCGKRRARRARRSQDRAVVGQSRRLHVSRLRDAAANLKSSSGDPGLDACCPRSSCGSRSNWPRPGSSERFRASGERFASRNASNQRPLSPPALKH